jgi:hypothetical protein
MIIRKAKTFIALPFNKKKLFFEAWLFQVVAGLLLKIIPFKHIPGLFPNPKPGTRNPERGTRNAEPGTLADIKTAVQCTSPCSIWRNHCLVQSLAGRWMLRRNGITSQLSLGLRKDDNKKLQAHAWLKVGDYEIVSKKDDYFELFTF